MSAQGQSRRLRDVRVAAALPPTAVMMLQCRKRRNVPDSDLGGRQANGRGHFGSGHTQACDDAAIHGPRESPNG